MSCCQGIEEVFSPEYVAGELKRYRARGASRTTRFLIEGIRSFGVQGFRLLDIGGGLGTIQHALLASGASTAVQVDASSAYLEASRQESQRLGLASRIDYLHGNFVDLAKDAEPAEIVTLDRVICCYGDMHKLLELSASHAKKILGLVYPRNTWWIKLGLRFQNAYLQLRRSPFRTYMHSSREVENIINATGFRRMYYRETWIWQVAIFSRQPNDAHDII